MTKRVVSLLLAQMLLGGLLLSATVGEARPVQAEAFANPAFTATWQRTDGPVASGAVARPYVWGQEPFATKTERYDSSPQSKRLVQYFDKGRMEVTRPEAEASNQWYVSSGLLVRDLVGGIVQVGDNKVQLYEPAEIPIAGDDKAVTPTYADFARDAFSGRISLSRVGVVINTSLRPGGLTATRPASAEPKVRIGYYEASSHRNIAAPFWDFMNATGPVLNPAGQSVTGTLFEWQYILGYPLTEPYWLSARVGGKSQEVLVQLFQRRVLIYNPAAPQGQQVEFGNVGRHWFDWQYSPAPKPTGDLSVPASVNASVNPKFGSLTTIFSFSAPGYAANEVVDAKLLQPDGRRLNERDLSGLKASATGIVSASFRGGNLSTRTNGGRGIYRLELKGRVSQRTSVIYWRIIERVPLTPTTPYKNDRTPPPPSVNAIVDPRVGPRGTTFLVFVEGFQVKELFDPNLAVWVTPPEGPAYGIDVVRSELVQTAEESLDGMLLVLGSPPTPGVWALTLTFKNNPKRKAVIYLKVTDAPPELTLTAALGIFTRGSTGVPGQKLWQPNLWQPEAKPEGRS